METWESCVVDVYNNPRHFHTGDGSLICGGYEVLTGNTINLNIQRARHCSWKTDAGIYLLGGNLQKYNGSQFKSTELIAGDSSQFGFELQYGTYAACGFADNDDDINTYIMTGGWYRTKVRKYSE